MRLIDADAYLARMKPRGISDELWEECETYKSVINEPTVEAIPIDWIEEWCLSQDLEYIRIAIKKMMDNWKVEREEE